MVSIFDVNLLMECKSTKQMETINLLIDSEEDEIQQNNNEDIDSNADNNSNLALETDIVIDNQSVSHDSSDTFGANSSCYACNMKMDSKRILSEHVQKHSTETCGDCNHMLVESVNLNETNTCFMKHKFIKEYIMDNVIKCRLCS